LESGKITGAPPWAVNANAWNCQKGCPELAFCEL
jgi:hypothetical protein